MSDAEDTDEYDDTNYNKLFIKYITKGDIDNADKLVKRNKVDFYTITIEGYKAAKTHKVVDYINMIDYVDLYRAVVNGDVQGFEELLSHYDIASDKVPDEIFMAIGQSGIVDFLDVIFDKGFDLIKNRYSSSFIFGEAIKKRNYDIVKEIIDWRSETGEYVNIANEYKAISSMVDTNSEEIVKLLLAWRGQNGEFIDIRITNNYCISYASQHGNEKIVKLLLEWRGPNGEFADPRDNNMKSLKFAIKNGRTKVIDMLIDWVGPNGEYMPLHQVQRLSLDNPLITACKANDISTVNKLLSWNSPNDEYVDATIYNNECADITASNGFADLLIVLIEWKGQNGETVDLSAQNHRALEDVSYNLKNTLEDLLENKQELEDLLQMRKSKKRAEEIEKLTNTVQKLQTKLEDLIYTLKIVIEWYDNNNKKLSDFIQYIDKDFRKYILVSYDINKIDVDKYDFGLYTSPEQFEDYKSNRYKHDYLIEENNKFIQYILSKYSVNKTKYAKLKKLMNYTSTDKLVMNSIFEDIFKDLDERQMSSIIGEYLI